MRQWFWIAGVIVIVLASSGNGWAKTNEELARENQELRQRVEKLEEQLQQVLQMMEERKPAGPETDKVAEAKAAKGKPLFPITNQFPITLYGHLKLDGSYDDSRTNSGNVPKYVLPDTTGDDDQFNLTARHTRLGLRLKGPEYKGIETEGNVEIDFYGKGEELNNNPRMRHAWFALNFPDRWRLLAGQTNDILGPADMATLNTAIGWGVGNIGSRKPQLRLEKGFEWDDYRLTIQAAAARPYAIDNDKDGLDDGEDAGIPDLQARISLLFPGLGGRPATLGLGGHWGQREIDFGGKTDRDFDSWSLVLDVSLPLHRMLTLQGELWTGQFLDAYQAGILQGFDIAEGKEVRSTGGFAQLSFTPSDEWKMNGGFGIDDPDNDTVSLRQRNLTYFFNVRRSLTKNVWIGVEYQRLETDYQGGDTAEDNRFQSTFCLTY